MYPVEFTITDVRCFERQQRGIIRPITLLIGENSTGKTSFLASYWALNQIVAQQNLPFPKNFDFNRQPFVMGSFRDIVRKRRGPKGSIDEFRLGFTTMHEDIACKLEVSFVEQGSQPHASACRFEFQPGVFFSMRASSAGSALVSIPDNDVDLEVAFRLTPIMRDLQFWIDDLDFMSERFEEFEPIADFLAQPADKRAAGSPKSRGEVIAEVLASGDYLASVAPLRSKPKRTYDPVSEAISPDGSHIPMLLMLLYQTKREQWKFLHDELLEFGKASGLFSDMRVKTHGKQTSDPFQLQVKVRSGTHANIVDVGYGISQSLPILVDILRLKAMTFLLQQPEVHLHPKGQAELASLFIKSYLERGHRFLVETHSDFIVDRVRISVQEGILSPEDVSILYFAPRRNAVDIHSISLDEDGNLLNVPSGYRDFFAHETNRLLGFKE